MPFETPITIRDAMHRIQNREYLLPGIQREFVWEPEQIYRLFDSMLRGYPIGSFLFWQVGEAHKADYKFYEFLRDYHEQNPHNPKASLLPAGGLTAVLDGQQRLSSLYIGLLGTHTERRKYGKKTAASSYVKRRLYLNLARPAETEDGGFDFRFHESDADFFRTGDDLWFRVGHILSYRQTTDVFDVILEQGLTASKHPKDCLVQLHRTVTELPLINYYTEVEQDLNRVLNIFIRVNSGGTELSYSDLLLSIASAQWEERDARDAVHALVDEINQEYGDFSFPRDFVLKCCLMLADVDLRWKVDNFNQANMKRIEGLWPKIEEAIRLAVITIAGFGFTGKTLASTNAVIPIVYYLFQRGSPRGFADSAAYRSDREAVHRWLNIVLLKQTFGGVPDNVLRPLREVIRESHSVFPTNEIEARLASTTRALAFRRGELEALVDLQYGSPYAFPLLAMLYPSLDFRNKFHQDHIHPKSHFTPSQLLRRGIPAEQHATYLDKVNRLPNLQLLEGQPNIEKSDLSLSEWLNKTFLNKDQKTAFLERNYIAPEFTDFADFPQFYTARRARLLDVLKQRIGAIDDDDLEGPEEVEADRELANFHPEVARRVAQHLGVELSQESQTCYASDRGDVRVVCVVSKAYRRGSQGRYWYAFQPSHMQFLGGAERGYVAFGCGGPGLAVLLPADRLVAALTGMRRTEKPDGRGYWHVELFGDSARLELGQPLLDNRIDVTTLLLQDSP